MKELSERLAAVARLIEPCEELIDVGCDHGYLSRYVLRAGLAARVVACDISPASLQKTRHLLHSYENVRFLCADGTEAVALPCDTAVVSGLGGPETLRFLPRANVKTLVLQPQNRVFDVRRALTENGWRIDADSAVCERGKYYDVLRAVRGSQTLSPAQTEFGVFCLSVPSPVLLARLQCRRDKTLSYPPTEENTKILALIKEVIAWQESR